MKSLQFFTNSIFALAISFQSASVLAGSLKKDFETLGDNQEMVERVKNLDSKQKVRIVQNRLVDRNLRLEVAAGYAANGGGDSYVSSQNANLQLEFHINPKFSIGLKGHQYYNKLTSEGKAQYDRAYAAQQVDKGSTQSFVGVDYPINAGFATMTYYPIYGKLNMFDQGVAHFDLYTTIGYGQMKLNSGSTAAGEIGMGLGFWMTQHLTSRLEVDYIGYKDLIGQENRSQNAIQGTFSIGVLL